MKHSTPLLLFYGRILRQQRGKGLVIFNDKQVIMNSFKQDGSEVLLILCQEPNQLCACMTFPKAKGLYYIVCQESPSETSEGLTLIQSARIAVGLLLHYWSLVTGHMLMYTTF